MWLWAFCAYLRQKHKHVVLKSESGWRNTALWQLLVVFASPQHAAVYLRVAAERSSIWCLTRFWSPAVFYKLMAGTHKRIFFSQFGLNTPQLRGVIEMFYCWITSGQGSVSNQMLRTFTIRNTASHLLSFVWRCKTYVHTVNVDRPPYLFFCWSLCLWNRCYGVSRHMFFCSGPIFWLRGLYC